MLETKATISPSIQVLLKELLLAKQKPAFGINAESRIYYIYSELDEAIIFATLRLLRWPEFIVCPRCKSTRVVLKESDENCHRYTCLACQEEAREEAFDDLTDAEVDENIAPLQSWILCWYLSSFCPIEIIARFVGLTPQQVKTMVQHMHHWIVESREQVEEKLKLELLLKKEQERYQELLGDQAVTAIVQKREEGGVFLRNAEDVKIAKERDQIHGGAPLMTKR